MQVLLTRDSVATGDDVLAPHARELAMPDGSTLRDVVLWLLTNAYVASVDGGSTWAVRARTDRDGSGNAVAVITRAPDSVVWAGDPFLQLGTRAHVHLEYLLRQDPDATLQLIRSSPARTNLRLG